MQNYDYPRIATHYTHINHKNLGQVSLLPTINDEATLASVKRSYSTLLVDSLIALLCIALVVLIASLSYGGPGGYVNVESPDGSFRYSLATDRHVVVHGPLGDTHIVIEHGSARITDSPCPTKTCIQQGAISTGSGWIACLPNQILLTIVSSGNGQMEVDDVSN